MTQRRQDLVDVVGKLAHLLWGDRREHLLSDGLHAQTIMSALPGDASLLAMFSIPDMWARESPTCGCESDGLPPPTSSLGLRPHSGRGTPAS